MNFNRIIKNRLLLGAAAFGAILLTTHVLRKSRNQKMPAISLLSPAKRLGTQGELTPERISNLISEATVQPRSHPTRAVEEPELSPDIVPPPDLDQLGYGRSKFLVDSKWATIRYVGDFPAGAGLTGAELNRAQTEALGTDRDTTPVTTAAQTITEMMDQYFGPLLNSLPRGPEILSRIKVQGAYYAPRSGPINGTELERDNAFIVGVQSLYIYPNSCFDKTSESKCSPLGFSTGHDPSIIGHELSHVIFNQMRDERTLEGWQWFAVNEGYADFFSACYFGDPVLGRIWRVSRPNGARYLRKLLDSPTTNDPKSLEEGHTLGSVWSSALWRSRNRIVSTFKINPFEFERAVLLSIHFLGESTKTRLGDAASAVLKAIDVLGQSQWKPILLEEFSKSEMDLARGQQIISAGSEIIQTPQGGVSCGQISSPIRQKDDFSANDSSLLSTVFLAAAAFIPTVLLRRRRVKKSLTALVALFLLQGCQLSSLWGNQDAKPGGLAVVYSCNLAQLKDGTPLVPTQRKLTLTFSRQSSTNESSEQIFIGDERFEKAESSLIIIVDKGSMRIDQFRRRDGSLFQLNLGQKYLNTEEAIAVQNMKLASIVIEGAGRAWKEKSHQSSISFDVTGSPATATIRQDIKGARGFGPLANEVQINNAQLCTYEKTID
jgi:hypothetical protein